ncbi:unnamed protein product [Tenebrio molitor]|nr:unnamed protein product [Tenebrio molitor]
MRQWRKCPAPGPLLRVLLHRGFKKVALNKELGQNLDQVGK